MCSRSCVCSTTLRNDSVVRTTIALQVLHTVFPGVRAQERRRVVLLHKHSKRSRPSVFPESDMPSPPLGPKKISRMYTSQTRPAARLTVIQLVLFPITEAACTFIPHLQIPPSCLFFLSPKPKPPKLNYRTSEHQPYAAMRPPIISLYDATFLQISFVPMRALRKAYAVAFCRASAATPGRWSGKYLFPFYAT